MKKVIIEVVLMLLVFSVLSVVIYNNRANNTITYTFTLDINPSIKINVDGEDKVVNIKLLNENAKDAFGEDDYKKEELETVIKTISEELEKNNYIDKDKMVILFNISDDSKKEKVTSLLKENFGTKTSSLNIITPEITEDAKKQSIRYKITDAKAAYILELVKSNSKLKISSLVNRPVDELYYMFENGVYCDPDYSLKSGMCVKRVGESYAVTKNVCPEGYYEYEEDCYKAENPVIEYYCESDYELKDNKCIKDNDEVEANIKKNCNENYKLYDNYMCLDITNKTEHISAKVCEEDNSELNGDICILYAVTDPYRK